MSFRIKDVGDEKIFMKCSCSPSVDLLQLNMYYVLCKYEYYFLIHRKNVTKVEHTLSLNGERFLFLL